MNATARSHERNRRAALVAEGIHSAQLEGGDVTENYQRDAQEYINGTITATQLLRRTQRRYGIKPIPKHQ